MVLVKAGLKTAVVEERNVGARTAGRRSVAESAGKKIADGRTNFRIVRLQREMPSVKEANYRVRNVALESLGPLWQEERIILAPHRQKARLVGAEIFLKGGVERDIALIVPKQVELQLGRAGPDRKSVV